MKFKTFLMMTVMIALQTLMSNAGNIPTTVDEKMEVAKKRLEEGDILGQCLQHITYRDFWIPAKEKSNGEAIKFYFAFWKQCIHKYPKYFGELAQTFEEFVLPQKRTGLTLQMEQWDKMPDHWDRHAYLLDAISDNNTTIVSAILEHDYKLLSGKKALDGFQQRLNRTKSQSAVEELKQMLKAAQDIAEGFEMAEAKSLIGTVTDLSKEHPEVVEILQKLHNYDESPMMKIFNIAREDEITEDQIKFILSEEGRDKIQEFKEFESRFADNVKPKLLLEPVVALFNAHPEIGRKLQEFEGAKDDNGKLIMKIIKDALKDGFVITEDQRGIILSSRVKIEEFKEFFKIEEAKSLIGTVTALLNKDPKVEVILQQEIKHIKESPIMKIINIAREDEITEDQIKFLLSRPGRDNIEEFKDVFAKFTFANNTRDQRRQ